MKAKTTSSPKGFSLIELLMVMAVIAIMVAMVLPSISGFSSMAGRRGAVTTVMNTLEQARVAALESGQDVYVVLKREALPEEDAMLVLREPESTSDPNWTYEQMSRWIKLPKGILFFDPNSGPASILDAGIGSFDLSKSPVEIPTSGLPSGKGLVAMKFNGSGQVAQPSASAGKLWLHIAEGTRDDNGTEHKITSERQSLPFEIITLSRYTGRAQLDITELSQ